MSNYNLYCVYITFYRGNKMPPFYIGSGTVKKILEKNYIGSVKSKEYSKIWNEEKKINPHLFNVRILCYFDTRKDASIKERKLQTLLDVVESPMYINKCIAQDHGFSISKEAILDREIKKRKTLLERYGVDNPAKLPHVRLQSSESRKNRKLSESCKNKISKTLQNNGSRRGANNSMYGLFGETNPLYGRKLSPERILQMSIRQTGTKHSQYDFSIYTFIHEKYGEFTGTCDELKKAYPNLGLQGGNLRRIANAKRPASTCGWRHKII